VSLLRIEGLSVAIGAQRVLNDVNLTVNAGEVLAVVGASGSGKSMTALAVMGLLPRGAVAEGAMRLGETALDAASERAMQRIRGARIGMVFQEPMTALNPVQTIGDQVAETIRLHRGASAMEARARAAETLARVGLSAEAAPPTRFPHELSGGQRQRVAIAIAIAAGPELILADEPTTALDVTTQAAILELLQDLTRRAGCGLMFITHDLAVAGQIADRAVVLEGGRAVETGPMAQVLAEPASAQARALRRAAADFGPRRPPPPEDAPALLTVERAVRIYPARRRGFARAGAPHRAVDGVSLTIRRGERVGLIGESGCGKSTLLRAILGLEPLQDGRIVLDGEDLGSARPRTMRTLRRNLQVVFQDPGGSFNPRHRVERLVSEPLALLDERPSPAERRRRVAALLEKVGLSAADAGKYPHEFSGGQRQRLAIARALILEPELILLDEAVAALDVTTRAQILKLLSDLAADLTLAYLFISHDLAVVRHVTDRVLVMKEGRVVETGPTAEVMARPGHPYTRALLAASPALPEQAA